MFIKEDPNKNVPLILTKLTKVIEFELKLHHRKFCDHISKQGEAIGPQSGVTIEKNAAFCHFFLIKVV